MNTLKYCYLSYRHELASELREERPFITLVLATELLLMACLLPAILLLRRGMLDATDDD
jgi:hypothetical protein